MGLPRHPRPFCYMSPSRLRDAALFALNWFRLLLVTCGSNATSSTWRPGRHLGRWMPRRWHTRAPQFLPPQRSAVAPAGGREAAPAGAHLTELAFGSLHACATTRGGAPRYNPGAGVGGRCKWDTQPRGGRSPPGARVPRGAARGSPADGGGARPGGAPGAGPEPAWAERCGPAESAGGCRRGLRTVRGARPPLPRSVPSGRSRPAATASEAGAASRCPARGRGARSPRTASAVPGVALGVRIAHGHARAPRVRGRRTGRWALKLPRAAHRAQHLPGAPTRCPARPGGHTALTFGRPPRRPRRRPQSHPGLLPA